VWIQNEESGKQAGCQWQRDSSREVAACESGLNPDITVEREVREAAVSEDVLSCCEGLD